MTATIIPFPKAPRGSLGTAEIEMGRLAIAVHLRALRKGRPSTYERALDACQRAWAEVQREREGA